jgi:hypothetical protein
VSNGDHSFTAHHDGKYIYCFSNEHWSASSKDVSFNVHGIVYVPEAEAPSDPLEAEGMRRTCRQAMHTLITTTSPTTIRASLPGQGRTVVHRCPRANSQKHGGEYQWQSKVVEHLPNGSSRWRRYLPSLVAQKILRGRQKQLRAVWRS